MRLHHPSLPRPLLPSLALLCLTLLAPAAVAASTASVVVDPDPVEDVPFSITVTGNADPDTVPTLYLADADGTCASGWGWLTPTTALTGAFTLTATGTVDEPAVRDVCFGPFMGPVTPLARVTVRAARATLTLRAPRIVRAGRPFTYTVGGHSELPQSVFVKLVGRRGCEPYYSQVFRWGELLRAPVQGPFSLRRRTRIGQTGRVWLCAFVQEDDDALRAVAVARAPVLVAHGRAAPRWSRTRVRRAVH
jgi:hypothetical protein